MDSSNAYLLIKLIQKGTITVNNHATRSKIGNLKLGCNCSGKIL